MLDYMDDTDAAGELPLYHAGHLRRRRSKSGRVPGALDATARRRPSDEPPSTVHPPRRHASPPATAPAPPGSTCPTGVTSPPVVILGHGLGATREMRLDAFAERFAQAGIAAVGLHLPALRRQRRPTPPAAVDQASARRLGRRHRLREGSPRRRRHPHRGLGQLLRRRPRHHRRRHAIPNCARRSHSARSPTVSPPRWRWARSAPVKAAARRRPGSGGQGWRGAAPVMIPLAGPPRVTGADERAGRTARLPGARAAQAATFRNEVAARVIPDHRDLPARAGSEEDRLPDPVLHQQHRHRHPARPDPPLRADRPRGRDQDGTTPATSTSTSANHSRPWSPTRSSS